MNFKKYTDNEELIQKIESIYNDKTFPFIVMALSTNDRIVILEYLKNILDIEDFKEIVKIFDDNPYNEQIAIQFKNVLKMMPIPEELSNNELLKTFKDKLNILK
jgi:hypothetical protein